jgi:ribonuclease P protein component
VAKRFTLGKKERLKSKKLIDQVFLEGKSFAVSPFRIYYLINDANKKELLQFGVGVSSRNFKKAVERNRIKRLTREAYRLQKNELKDKLTVVDKGLSIFLIYTGKELPEFDLVKQKVAVALKKLIILVDEIPVADT